MHAYHFHICRHEDLEMISHGAPPNVSAVSVSVLQVGLINGWKIERETDGLCGGDGRTRVSEPIATAGGEAGRPPILLI